MGLSVIIPVWNDVVGLVRLVNQIIEYGLAQEIIICDDCSDMDHAPDAIGLMTDRGVSIVYKRSTERRGAGAMRNVGISLATEDFILFLDSDDAILPGMSDIISSIKGESFDFCIFRHADSRVTTGDASFPEVETQWERAGIKTGDVTSLNGQSSSFLSQIPAYPWNKVYSTDFLRRKNVRCTEIAVHNDIELHWVSFIKADRILATGTAGVRHFVSEGGARLTNKKGVERLQVFEALRNTMFAIEETRASSIYVEPFLSFCNKLINWVVANIDGEHHHAVRLLLKEFYLNNISIDHYALVALRNPKLANDISQSIKVVRK